MRLIDADALRADRYVTSLTRNYLLQYVSIEQIDNAPTIPAPRWVRCEDELPRKTRKFVVWVPVTNGPYPCWYEERTALWQSVEKKWYVDHNPKTWWVGEPTHWMPIEPPKEE